MAGSSFSGPLRIKKTDGTKVEFVDADGNLTGNFSDSTTVPITDGSSLVNLSSNTVDTATTTGSLLNLTSTASTAGTQVLANFSGLTTGIGASIVANSITTGTAELISITGQTSGVGLQVNGGGANMTSGGKCLYVNMGASTTGIGLYILSTGAHTGTGGILSVDTLATSGVNVRVNDPALTTGINFRSIAAAATLTTGRYYSASDGALEVWGIGANGHIHTQQTTAPVMTTNATGISATTIIAGSSDVAGGFTTVGTPTSGTVLTCTFNKTYTAAPKAVAITPLNAAAGNPNTVPYVSLITATTFVLTWPAGGTYAATPSYSYIVIA